MCQVSKERSDITIFITERKIYVTKLLVGEEHRSCGQAAKYMDLADSGSC